MNKKERKKPIRFDEVLGYIADKVALSDFEAIGYIADNDTLSADQPIIDRTGISDGLRSPVSQEKLFEDIIDDQLAKIKDTILIKGKEYRRNCNPFHNFDVGASITGKTREEVLWGFALKHFISIQDIKEDVKSGKLPTRHILDEKYGDLLNYLLIEKASLILGHDIK